jgi:PKD repeat protein
MGRGLRLSLLVSLVLAFGTAEAHAATYDFSVNPSAPAVGQITTFQLQGPLEDVDRVRWDLDGDGELDDGKETVVTYEYSAAGPVTVQVRVTEHDKDREVVTKTISVTSPPSAAFSFAPARPVTRQRVFFTAETSDPDGDAVTLSWAFGDGHAATGTNPTHAYARAGGYTVVLTATDEHGAFATTSQTVTVERPLLMQPFPIVRIAGILLPRGASVHILSVRAPRGARMRVRCRGGGCPVESVARTSRTGVARFHRFERILPAGTTLELFVRQPRQIGKYTRFVIRAGKPPARVDRCLMPGRARPVRC